jgi:hypothetical protein
MAQSQKIARVADAFEAAYDDGVRDEALRWAAGQVGNRIPTHYRSLIRSTKR